MILKGLPQDYESTISLITGKFGSVSIEEVETLLLCHESRLDRFPKNTITSANANLTTSSVASNIPLYSTNPHINVTESTQYNSNSVPSCNFVPSASHNEERNSSYAPLFPAQLLSMPSFGIHDLQLHTVTLNIFLGRTLFGVSLVHNICSISINVSPCCASIHATIH